MWLRKFISGCSLGSTARVTANHPTLEKGGRGDLSAEQKPQSPSIPLLQRGKLINGFNGLSGFIALILLFTLTACGEPKLPSPFKANDVTSKYAQADFHLFDASGKPRSLADYRGKVVALFFGYTHCPDVCPTTLADMAGVMEKLGKDADKVQVLFVTVDPERDTRELLAQYPPAFYPTFIGLLGDTAATQQATKAFGIVYQKQASKSGSYTVDHSAGTFLISPSGKTVLLSPFAQHPAALLQDIRLLLTLK
jgi:protein SCO1/2